MEILNDRMIRGRISHALFDFDGTLSLIREGWQGIMISLAVEWLLETPRHEGESELRQIAQDLVAETTGKDTIYQMRLLGDQVLVRGGRRQEAQVYKRQFLERLWQRSKDRREGLAGGRIPPEELMVPGARAILHALAQRHVRCYLASGTDQSALVDESAALGIAPFFADVYGAHDDDTRSAKSVLIDRVVADNHLSDGELVVFGDGAVEIAEARRVGALAIGVATDEAARTGIDLDKRRLLIEAGADLIIPDFGESDALVKYLFDA